MTPVDKKRVNSCVFEKKNLREVSNQNFAKNPRKFFLRRATNVTSSKFRDFVVMQADAMGIALHHQDEHSFLQPVDCKFKTFSQAQKKIASHDREGLALLYALKLFRHFLLIRRFEVQTDNSGLCSATTSH